MSDWSMQRVEQLAPDAAAIKAGQGLARRAKWKSLGRDQRLLWGECQGSGANPYQVRVDLDDGACKCSCPSRKLPCKHALGLLMMLAAGESIETASMPAFVEEWAAGRAKRAETRSARAATPDKLPDADAQAQRIEKREARIDAGLAQLEEWLADIVKQGLAMARTQPTQFWSQMGSRLIDMQAPGLARRVQALGDAAVSGDDWQSQLLLGLARTQLLIDAYRRRDRLPAPMAAEVRTLIGWTQAQDALLERAGIRDRWHVLGHRQGQDERIRTQLTWLAGQESARIALMLDFAAGNQPLPASFRIGQVVDAEVVYFDGAPPLRVLLKQRYEGLPASHALPAPLDIANMQRRFAELLAENPLLERWPVVLGPVTFAHRAERGEFTDTAGRRIATNRHFRHGWQFEALSGGRASSVFGLWDGHTFDPVSLEHQGRLFSLAHLGELPVLSRVA